MNTTTRALLIACLALPFVAGCQNQDAAQEQGSVAQAPLTAPTTDDEAAWGEYLVAVVKRNMEDVSGSPYLYALPAESDPDYQGSYDRLLEKAQQDLQRGIVAGNLLAYGGPSSAKSADFTIASFQGVQAESMKGVRVLFIGKPEDNERVRAAVAPSGVDYRFIEAK